jgi:DNA-binding NtrC family response regulator
MTDSAKETFGGMVGRSDAMRELFGVLRQAAKSDATVLIQGETGTGKEACAEAIHREGRRRDGPFMVVDCGAIPQHLLESELFGHERGAFTGAAVARSGAFEAAAGGTILLDEIGELSFDLQPKILRAIEARQIKRIGSPTHIPVDVRVLAATNRNLSAEVTEKRFRSDLYYRLAVVHIKLPPLRSRTSDIPDLVEHVLKQLGTRDTDVAAELLSAAFLARLGGYHWPGNVRQLRNYVERCVALGDANVPLADTILPPAPSGSFSSPPVSHDRSERQGSSPDPLELPFKEARQSVLAAFERRYLAGQLARHRDNVSAAARASGIGRLQFYRLLWKHRMRGRESDDEE